MNLDPGRVAAAVTPRTRAVIAVHLFGRPLDWEVLLEAVPEGVVLVEDAAGALGALRRGRPCGGARRPRRPPVPPPENLPTGGGGGGRAPRRALPPRVPGTR